MVWAAVLLVVAAAARVQDSTLVVLRLGGTELGCEAPLMAQEGWVGEMLRSRPRLELSGPTLSLLRGGHWLGLTAQPDGSDGGA